MKNLKLALLTLMMTTITLFAREQIKIVGSSTVYPFSLAIASEFENKYKYKKPRIASTGSSGGIKLFCAGNGINMPDIANASRRMKPKELKICKKHGINNITEAMIGYDGIVFAHFIKNNEFSITKEQLALATAKLVPSKDKKSFIKNPYKKWSDINASLPNQPIIIYGPPKSSGTRDTFEELILKKVLTKKSQIRNDGVYIPAGENDNLIVKKLIQNKNAFGIFGFSFLIENKDKIKAAKISNILPTVQTISEHKYPISRSLFFYIKNSHYDKVLGMKEYIDLFISDEMISQNGNLSKIGLIELSEEKRNIIQKNIRNKVKITLEDLTN
jgi:phosphate transport system substrate-binding protein